MGINWYASRLRIINPLWSLQRMIKRFNLQLSSKAKLRLKWMDYYHKTKNASLTCRHFGIAKSVFWYWYKKYDPQNLKSLEDQSRAPKTSPKSTPDNIRIQVIRLKKQYPRWGKEKLAIILKRDFEITLSPSTVYRIYKKANLSFKYRSLKRPNSKKHKLPINWAKNAPGDLIEVDTKFVFFNGLKYYQFTAIDVVSKWRFLEIRKFKNQKESLLFIKNLIKEAPFKIKMIKSDNGSEFKNKLVQKYIKSKGMKFCYIHKSSPDEQGTVERSHRTDEEEFYSLGNLTMNLDVLNQRIKKHCYIYNNVRPHWSLNGQTPNEFLKINTVQHVLT